MNPKRTWLRAHPLDIMNFEVDHLKALASDADPQTKSTVCVCRPWKQSFYVVRSCCMRAALYAIIVCSQSTQAWRHGSDAAIVCRHPSICKKHKTQSLNIGRALRDRQTASHLINERRSRGIIRPSMMIPTWFSWHLRIDFQIDTFIAISETFVRSCMSNV